MITFDHVSKRYNEHVALHDVHFKIHEGEFVVITGPSGGGKTTIAKLILGADVPSQGTVTVRQQQVGTLSGTTLNTHRQNIGMVFQDCKLLPYKTVFENVAFVLEVCGLPDAIIQSSVTESLATVGMLPAKNKFPSQLSGGEKQRVAIARAIAHRPALIIADEPTGNLDQENTAEVIALLRTVHALPSTVILMTHDHHIVNTLGARVITLANHTVSHDSPAAHKL